MSKNIKVVVLPLSDKNEVELITDTRPNACVVGTKTTNKQGIAIFHDVRDGNYCLSITRAGFETISLSIVIMKGHAHILSTPVPYGMFQNDDCLTITALLKKGENMNEKMVKIPQKNPNIEELSISVNKKFSQAYEELIQLQEEDVIKALERIEVWQHELNLLKRSCIVQAYDENNLVPRGSFEAFDCCKNTCQNDEKET